MFKPRTLLLFGIAFVLALAAVFIAKRWVAVMQDPSRHYTSVVVAAREITFLSPISESDIKVIEFPKAHAPDGSLSRADQVIGKIVTQTTHPGEVLLSSRIRDHMGGSLLAHTLPNNTRAVSVRVNDVSGVGGFILPGSLVDVLVSRKQGVGPITTETIVNAAKVMAVGQETSAEKQTPLLVQVVTLELSPPDAERVVQATAEGTIHLILRNPGDHSIYLPRRAPPEKSEVTGPRELSTTASQPPMSGRTAKPKQPSDVRRLIKGNKEVWMECTPTECDELQAVTKGHP
jgi:Flp pilus assembly protein CpaB